MGRRIEEPCVVQFADGEVRLCGPDGLTASFTPEAAAQTASLMIELAAYALGANEIAAARAHRDHVRAAH
jgi:hypothetical protein